jgi:outer membrane protein OmpA-like peptidoglycan-associated protein
MCCSKPAAPWCGVEIAGAEAQLRPLAGYLRANPRVQLRIDGYTDSVGSDASNLTLSRNRARSVADALAGMGANGDRFVLEGHGEASPVASNANADGRQLNRRVEVTLVGQRASSFD